MRNDNHGQPISDQPSSDQPSSDQPSLAVAQILVELDPEVQEAKRRFDAANQESITAQALEEAAARELAAVLETMKQAQKGSSLKRFFRCFSSNRIAPEVTPQADVGAGVNQPPEEAATPSSSVAVKTSRGAFGRFFCCR
jgi:hypothetical protein